MTQQEHVGNFGYAYGIVFHQGHTDGLEREFNDHLHPVSYFFKNRQFIYFFEKFVMQFF